MGGKKKGKPKPKPKYITAFALLIALLLAAPAFAQERPPRFGCAQSICSLYFVSAGWSPAGKKVVVGGNAVEWFTGHLGLGIWGMTGGADFTWAGAGCYLPSLNDTPVCKPVGAGSEL